MSLTRDCGAAEWGGLARPRNSALNRNPRTRVTARSVEILEVQSVLAESKFTAFLDAGVPFTCSYKLRVILIVVVVPPLHWASRAALLMSG